MDRQRDQTARDDGGEGRGQPGAHAPDRHRSSLGVPIFKAVATLLTSQVYVVRGDSMRPTFEPGQHLLVSRMAYAASALSRGDVVVLRDPRDSGRRILKRVVGLPGEEVRIRDGLLFVDGVHMDEPYLGGLPASVGLGNSTWGLGSSEYFVAGDDRVRSTDSREYGPVPEGLIVGRAWYRYWPLRERGLVR